MKKQILKNFFSSWFSKFIKLGTSLLLVPIFIDELGKEGYGIIILVGSIISFSTLFELGVRTGLVRFLAKSYSKRDFQLFNEYLNTAIVIYLGIWLMLSSLLIFGAPFLVTSFSVSNNYNNLAVLLLRTFGVITIFWSFTSPIFGAITAAFNRYDVTNYRQSLISTISIISVIIAVKYFNFGIVGWAFLTVIFDAITAVSILVIAFRLAPFIEVTNKKFKKSRLNEMLRFGFIAFIGGWSRKMKIDADPLILSSFLGPAAIPIYRAGVSMPSHARPLIGALTGQIHTVSTAYYSTGDTARFSKVFESGTKYTLLMGVPLLVLFMFFADNILQLWLGSRLTSQELHNAALCMQGMALIDFCFYLEGSSYAILYGMNKLKFMTFTDIFLGIINISASILLVRYSGWGIPSVLLPTIILEGLARPWYLFYTARVMGYPQRSIWPNIYLPAFAVLFITVLVGWVIDYLITPNSLVSLVVAGASLGVVWLVVVWLLGLTNADKIDFKQTIKFK